MPLSRFTHTFPLDFAEAISGSEAAPVGEAFVEVFLGGAELAAGAEVDVEELAGALGAIADLLAAAVAGAELVVEAGAASLAAVLLFLPLLLVGALVSALVLLLRPLLAGASPVVSAAFFLRLSFVVPPASAAVEADWSALADASADFFLRLLLVVPVSELALAPALAD